MNIILSVNNAEIIKTLPVVPPDISIDEATNIETFQTMNSGELILLGEEGLRSLSIDSIFPNHNYPWLKSGSSYDGWTYVDFIKKYKKEKRPMRIVITSKFKKEVLNMPVVVESFSYSLDQTGDIRYSIQFKEYKFVDVR